jgi:signal transduction histidine kinase
MPSDVGQPDEDKVFQRFYRAESAKKFSGSGQGLWLAQQLAMAMNSKIELTRFNDLTCFTLYLSQD